MKKKSDSRPADSTDRKPLADVRLDAELMNQLSAAEPRNDRPLEELMARHEGLVFNELARRNIRPCDVEDVANLVWMKMWKIGRDGKWNADRAVYSQDPFLPLLHRVVNSEAMDFHRKAARERKKTARIVEACEAWGDEWRDRLAGAGRRAKKPEQPLSGGVPDSLRPVVETLPDRLRIPYELHANGLTNREIAVKIGCSWGEVSRRLKAARRSIAAAGIDVPCAESPVPQLS